MGKKEENNNEKSVRTITLEVPAGKEPKWVNGILTLVDIEEKDNRPVIERIKTFQDALDALGENHSLVKEWNEIEGVLTKDLTAYLKLRIIAAALNEGWVPAFDGKEKRYYPWFYFYTKEEYDRLDEDDKKKLWLFGGNSLLGSYCGLAFADSYSAWTGANSRISARLAVKSEELALYFGKQFIDIWADYVGPFKTEE